MSSLTCAKARIFVKMKLYDRQGLQMNKYICMAILLVHCDVIPQKISGITMPHIKAEYLP